MLTPVCVCVSSFSALPVDATDTGQFDLILTHVLSFPACSRSGLLLETKTIDLTQTYRLISEDPF